MAELVFPLAALALVFLFVMPALTVLSRALLSRRRHRTDWWPEFGSAGNYALLLAPTVLPLVWLGSGALHHTEETFNACLLGHLNAEQCTDAVILSSTLVGLVLFSIFRNLWKHRPLGRSRPVANHHQLQRRVDQLTAAIPALAGLDVVVMANALSPAVTRGLLRPRIEVDACFVRQSDDEALRSALLHEAAHASGRDPLRYLLGQICLALNPARRLLQADFRRWVEAREAVCDQLAIKSGGEPLALAHAIVSAASFRCGAARNASCAATLSGRNMTLVRLRLALLQAPQRPLRSEPWLKVLLMGSILIALAISFPHTAEESILTHLHHSVELLAGKLGLS